MKFILEKDYKSLKPFRTDLPDFSIITGINGSGKTQLLESIAVGHSKLYINDQLVDVLKIKQVSNANMITNESYTYDPSYNEQIVGDLWNDYQNALAEIRNLSRKNNDYPKIKLYRGIALKAKKSVEDLTFQDFTTFCPGIEFRYNFDIFSQNFSSIFGIYLTRIEENEWNEYQNIRKGKQVSFFTKSEFDNIFGTPPWEIVNEILEDANLPFRITSPTNGEKSFVARLISTKSGSELKFQDLSGGEKILMCLVLALFNSKSEVTFPQVILMDEPDSVLHPLMIRQFLVSLTKLFVKDRSIKIILITHSATTVAIADEQDCDFFIMRNYEGTGLVKCTKDTALNILTEGVPSFSVNYENRRQVFVESKNDVLFYESLYKLVSKHLISEVSLSFISSGDTKYNTVGIGIASCDQVKTTTKILRDNGNKFVWGIIDYDLKNKSTEFVIVLGENRRYNIENYLFDPIFMAALLLREKLVEKSVFGLDSHESFSDFKNFSEDRLQHISNTFIQLVDGHLLSDVENEPITTRLLNNSVIHITKKYLQYQGHRLETDVILKKWPELNSIRRGEEAALKLAILNFIIEEMPDLLPEDIVSIFRTIQS